MAFVEDADYEAWLKRKREAAAAAAPVPSLLSISDTSWAQPSSSMAGPTPALPDMTLEPTFQSPPAARLPFMLPSTPEPTIQPSQPISFGQTIPSAWMPPPQAPEPPPRLPWVGRPSPPLPEPTIPMPTRPFRPEAVDIDLPETVTALWPGVQAAQKYVFDPAAGLISEALPVQYGHPAYKPPFTGPEHGQTPLDWWAQAGERERERGTQGLPSIGQGAVNVAPLTPGEFGIIGRGLASGIRALPAEARTAARAVEQAARSPALARAIPAASLKAVEPAPQARRFYHGTGTVFDVPDAAMFDPNGLKGPAYYLSDKADVAGGIVDESGIVRQKGYAQKGQTVAAQQVLQAKADAIRASGHPGADYLARSTEAQIRPNVPNVRAVDIPQNLNLFDAEIPDVPAATIDQIAGVLPQHQQQSFRIQANNARWQGPRPTVTGETLYNLLADVTNSKANANAALQKAGFDGVEYAGGRHMPLLDDQGRAIEHTALAIFPESLPKITNAISGTPMGSAPEVGGAIVGALAAPQDPNASPLENLKTRALWAAGGGLVGYGGRRLGQTSRLGGTLEDASKYLDDTAARYDEIQARITEIESQFMDSYLRRGAAKEVTHIERPPWAGSISNARLEQVAREHGLNPYETAWYDRLDPAALTELGPGQRSGKLRQPVQTDEALAALNKEHQALTAEAERLQAGAEAGYQAALEKPAAPATAGGVPASAGALPGIPGSAERAAGVAPEALLGPLGKPPVDESIIPPRAGRGVTGQPWQRTQKEYLRANQVAASPSFFPSGSRLGKLESRKIRSEQAASMRATAENHRMIIERALSEGNPVPPAVLADYPDLSAKYVPVESSIITSQQLPAPMPKGTQAAMFGATEPGVRPEFARGPKPAGIASEADLLGGPQFETEAARAQWEREQAVARGQGEMFGAPAPVAAAKKPKVRFEAGKKLTPEERKQVLRSVVDTYKAKDAPKVVKGIGRDGEEIVGYEYNPDYFEQSGVTGRGIRYYIKLPDGTIAHPSELYPELTDNAITKALEQERGTARRQAIETKDMQARRDARVVDSAAGDDQAAQANRRYIQTSRAMPYSYFARDEGGAIVRVDGMSKRDVDYYASKGFTRISEPVKPRPENAEQVRRIAAANTDDLPPEVLADYPDLAARAKPAEAVAPTEVTVGGAGGGEAATKPLVAFSPEDISYERAVRAYSGVSWEPETRAASVQADYVAHMQQVQDVLRPLAKTPEQLAKLSEGLERYRQGYLQRLGSYLDAKSRVVSSFIAGPSKFPFRQMEKRNETEHKRLTELLEWSRKAQKAIRNEVAPETSRVISSDNPEAVALLQKKIAAATDLQQRMVEGNKIVRRKDLTDLQKVEQLAALGMTEKTARTALEPDFMGRIGFPDYALKNNSAEIRRLQGRVEELARSATTPGGETVFDGGRIIDNAGENRIQIIFDAMPDKATRESLVRHGFKWAPSQGAWQRQRTDNARAAVERLFPDARKGEEAAPTEAFVKPQVLDDAGETAAPAAVLTEAPPPTAEAVAPPTIDIGLPDTATRPQLMGRRRELVQHVADGEIRLRSKVDALGKKIPADQLAVVERSVARDKAVLAEVDRRLAEVTPAPQRAEVTPAAAPENIPAAAAPGLPAEPSLTPPPATSFGGRTAPASQMPPPSPNAVAFIDEITAAPDLATLKSIARTAQHEATVTHTLTTSDSIAIDRAMEQRRSTLIAEAETRTAARPMPERPQPTVATSQAVALTAAQDKVLAPARKAVLSGKGSLKVWRDEAGNVYVERATGGSAYSYSTVSPDGTVKSGMPEQQVGWTVLEDSKAGGGPVAGTALPPKGAAPTGPLPPLSTRLGVPPAKAVRPPETGPTPAETVPPEPPPTAPGTPPTAVPPPPSRPGFAGNIRLSKHPEPLREEIKAVYDQEPAKFEAARRGVRPDAEVRADAVALIDSVGGNGEKSVKKWQAGQAWNAEEVLALREVLAARTKTVLNAQQALRNQGDSTANLVRLRLAIEEQKLAQEAVAGVTAEAGRALRQFRQNIEGLIAAGDEQRLKAVLDRLGGRQNAEELATALGKVDLGNQEAVYRFIRNATKPKAADYLTEMFYNSILSGVRTHEVNTIGNLLAAVLAPVETVASAVAGLPLAAIQRRPRERFFRELTPQVFGMLHGLPEGVRKALYILKNGYSWDDVAKLEIRRPQAFKGKLGAVINTPSRALAAGDAVFRSIHYAGALNAGAYRIARRAGLKGQALAGRIADLLANPTPELLSYAGKMEEYRVYQQQPGQFARGLVQIRDIEIAGLQPIRFALPFIQTPVNLLKYGLERSPLGVLNPSLWRNVLRRDPEAADQLGRWLVGSAIAATVALYAADGGITGAAPEGRAERDLFYRQGKQPYAIRVGDRWLPYNRFEPFNQPLAQVAAVVGAMREGKDVRESVGSIVAGIGKNLVSQTYMSGVADLLNAIDDPERYGTNIFERSAVGLGIPFSAATRTIAQTIDPTIRQSKGLIEELQASVPGLSQKLLPRLNAFGEEVKRESPAYLPVELRREKNDPVDQELARLKVNVGFVGNSIRNVALSREEQHEYQRLAGQEAKKNLGIVVTNPIYQNLEDDITKAAILDGAIRRAHDKSALEMLASIGKDEIRRRRVKPAVR